MGGTPTNNRNLKGLRYFAEHHSFLIIFETSNILRYYFNHFTLVQNRVFPILVSKLCHQLLLSGETQYQSKPEFLPG